MQANTIDGVIDFLSDIISTSKNDQSPMGYFAALYRKVTISVKEGIANGVFEDGSRMERLDVIFANRYLEAYTQFQNREKPSISWESAFLAAKTWQPIVLQHLLLGMNAHINLDLGIAAAEVCPGDKIDGLENDFMKINTILSDLVGEVQEELSNIWPTLKKILRWTGKADDFLVDFSMTVARNEAWAFAKQLAHLDKEAQTEAIVKKDNESNELAKLIVSPGIIISTLLLIIRLGEKGTVADRITDLAQ